MKSIIPALLFVAAGSAAAQQPAPDGTLIRAGIDTMAVFVINDTDTTRTGTVIDEISIVNSKWGRVLRRVYRSRDRVMGVRVDTLIDNSTTLAPVSIRSRPTGSYEFIDFVAGRATGWLLLANGDSVAVDAPIPGTVFSASSFDLVLRASPLSETWKVEVPSFLPSTRTVVMLTARVVAAEMVDGAPAWRIQADFAGTPVTFWVDRDSRRLVKQLMQIRPDLAILHMRTQLPPSTPRRIT